MKKLPTADDRDAIVADGPDATPDSTQPDEPKVSPFRLVSTLGIAGAVAGLAIVSVFQWAQPRILHHRAEAMKAAVEIVLSGPARYETLYVLDSGLSLEPAAGADTVTAEKVFLGYDEAGNPIGYAILGSEPGYQDFVTLIFGYDVGSRQVLGMRVLDNKETPGLGDKIVKDTVFVNGFTGAVPPLVGMKAGAGTGDASEVDMITGATISSRTVIRIMNHRIEALEPALKAYMDRLEE